MPVRLIDSLSTTEPLSDIFSDTSVLRAMLDFEVALARVQARLGIIPSNAADAIASACRTEDFDFAQLSRDALRAGTPGIPLVKALTEQVRAENADAAKFVHWGATSQDVADTALVLLLKQVRPSFLNELTRMETALRKCSDQHVNTVMLGRTLMQAAPPVTFGLKAAGWFAAVRRCHSRLELAFSESLILQFGGATGTLAALGNRGVEVARALASELDLEYPEASWHTHRDRLANLLCTCGVLTCTLGKIARDIALLMQNEVAEVAEPSASGRGGSSTMPHKNNPVGSTITLAAANRVPGLLSSFLTGMVQEHERGAGSWQSEWPTVAAMVQTTGTALASMVEVAEGLTVDRGRMRTNIEATRGLIFAERAMMLLGPALGRDVAHTLMEEASRKSVSQNRHLADVLGEIPEVAKVLDKATLSKLEQPEEYLGVAEEFRTRLLSDLPDRHK